MTTWILMVMLYNNSGPIQFSHVAGFADEKACTEAADGVKLGGHVDAFCVSTATDRRDFVERFLRK